MNSSGDFLIVALDFDNAQSANDLIHKIPKVNFFKIGMELFFSEGPEIVYDLKSRGKKIFLDLKINDIPKTMEKAVKKITSYGVEYLTVFCDEDGIKAAREGAAGGNIKILNVSVLTSRTAVFSDVFNRSKMSYHAGADGIICSGLETSGIRTQIPDKEFIIVNPGIRLSQDSDDQIRVVTPEQAKQAGATNIVVGRPVTQSPDPAMVVENIFQSLS